MNHVFISYRHEGEDHIRAVRRLGDLLRQAKIPVELDQFYVDEHPGGPDEGWPKWSEDRATKSACVLIIGSPGWFAAYEKTGEPRTGLGAASEADLFRQAIWDEQGNNARIRVTFLDKIDLNIVPDRLRTWHQFRPFSSDRELDQMIDWVGERLGLHGVKSPTVRWPEALPDFKPDIANRHVNEWPAIRDMLAGKTPHRILLLEAETGYGKSELIECSVGYAAQLQIPVARLDFKANYGSVGDILGWIGLGLGDYLPNFAGQGADKTHLLIKDLRALRQPVLLVLDTFDKATADFQDWACQNLLAEVERALSVTLIVAGQARLPDLQDVRWGAVARQLRLGPIREVADWEPWINRRYPDFAKRKIDVSTLVWASGGVPRPFTDLCRIIAKQPLP